MGISLKQPVSQSVTAGDWTISPVNKGQALPPEPQPTRFVSFCNLRLNLDLRGKTAWNGAQRPWMNRHNG